MFLRSMFRYLCRSEVAERDMDGAVITILTCSHLSLWGRGMRCWQGRPNTCSITKRRESIPTPSVCVWHAGLEPPSKAAAQTLSWRTWHLALAMHASLTYRRRRLAHLHLHLNLNLNLNLDLDEPRRHADPFPPPSSIRPQGNRSSLGHPRQSAIPSCNLRRLR